MPSDTELLDLPAGIGNVVSSVVWELLDRAHNVVTTINPSRAENATVNVRAGDTVKRTLSGLWLTPSDFALVDVNADRIRPSWLLPGGTRYPLGVFMFSQAVRRPHTWGTSLDGTMYDQTVILDQPRETSLSLAAGASVDAAIAQIVSGDGLSFPAVAIPTTNVTVASPISWPAGDSRYAILSGLFTLANLYPPFFDNNGVLTGKPVPPDLARSGSYDHIYAPGTASRVVRDSVAEADETITAPNRYLVVDNGPTQEPIVAWYDIDPFWPHSFARRGYRVTKKVSVNGLANSTAAYDAAVRDALVDLNAGRTFIEFDSTPDPRHDIYQIVQYGGISYREAAWSLRLRPGGPHSHSLTGLY